MENVDKKDSNYHDAICRILQAIAEDTEDEKVKRIMIDMMDINTMGLILTTISEIMALVPEMEAKMNDIVAKIRVKMALFMIAKLNEHD